MVVLISKNQKHRKLEIFENSLLIIMHVEDIIYYARISQQILFLYTCSQFLKQMKRDISALKRLVFSVLFTLITYN